MAETFSESWYKVASLRVALRPTVNFRRQTFRGQTWYVLHDPYSGTFFRLSPGYYDFVARLDFSHTVEELWTMSLEAAPESAPGQKDVINLLIRLNGSNLLYFQDSANSSVLFERGSKKEQKQTRQRWFNVLFIRFPIWNPENWLSLFMPLWKVLYSKLGAILWVLCIAFGLKVGIEHAREFTDQAGNLLAPGNLLLLYLGIAIIKIFHEIGHASICKRFGGEVHTIGVMFLIFVPLPFVDATSSWAFQQKWQRILVSSGGMIVELFIGSIACVVWAYSPPGIVHAIAYNMMFTATFSTLIFNANPLMRFDGYYILADLVEIPNLYQRSREMVYALWGKYVFGLYSKVLPSYSLSEGFLLTLYGIASMVYRVVLFVGIGLFLADRYFSIGLIMALVMTFTWLVVPPLKFAKYLLSSPELRLVRVRAILSVLILFIIPLIALILIPLPKGITIPGVVVATDHADVIAKTGGIVEHIVTIPNTRVKKGQPLMLLNDADLDLEIQNLAFQLKQIEITEQEARRQRNVDRLPIEKRKNALNRARNQLLERKVSLTVRASQDGVWSFPESRMIFQQWVARGQRLGVIISEQRFHFDGIINQEDASDLFETSWKGQAVRLKGIADVPVPVLNSKIIPHAQTKLPSPAIGWKGGGPVALADSDTDGTTSREPFYLVNASLENSGDVTIKHGQTGFLYLEMAPQTMVNRLIKYLRQFMQRRYQL